MHLLAISLGLAYPAAGAGESPDAARERFLMEGGHKAHVLVRERGAQARLLVAFPEGNLAAAIWISGAGDSAPHLALEDVTLVTEKDSWAARTRIRVPAGPLKIDRVLFHSIRTVRGFTEGYPTADQQKVDGILAALGALSPDVTKILDERDLGRAAFTAWSKRLPEPDPIAGTWTYSRPGLGTGQRYDVTIVTFPTAPVSPAPASVSPAVPPATPPAAAPSSAALAPSPSDIAPPTSDSPAGSDSTVAATPPSSAAPAPSSTVPTPVIEITSGVAGTIEVTARIVTVRPSADGGKDRSIPPAEILSAEGKKRLADLAKKDPALHAQAERALTGIAFLASDDALLAGSWRFLTYFGRDTLLFTMLMGSHLSERMWNAAIGSVLARSSPEGRVAHEESVGEYGALEKMVRYLELRSKDPAGASLLLADLAEGKLSRHDYHMVDTELLVPLALARYLEVHPAAARKLIEERRDGIVRNLTLVTSLMRGPVAREKDPWPAGLVALREGLDAGDWRDSGEGLGKGRYPASVNATLMPAAIEAMADLVAHDALKGQEGLPASGELDTLRAKWTLVYEKFVFEYTPDDVAKNAKYLEDNQLAVPAGATGTDPMRALALSLDATGKRIPVLHGDGLFLLLAPRPPPVDLEAAIGPLARPFPRGLSTPAGPLVASAVVAPEVQPIFRRANYHGLVIWSWPMVLARQAVERLRKWDRQDLATRLEAEVKTWGPPRLEPEELWSVKAENGQLTRTSFGDSLEDVTESNSLQLWSLASLASLLAP